MPVAMRTDVIDQILAMALHPISDCSTATVSAAMIQYISQSPETHVYIVWKKVVGKMLEICNLKQKMVTEQSSQFYQGKREDPMAINSLK